MKVLLVYNPFAGHGKAKKIFSEIEKEFIRKEIKFDIEFTEYRGHAVEIVKDADISSYDGIIAAGGDGTLFEVINGLYKNSFKKKNKIPLGVLPIGTGNAFCRDIGLATDAWKEAISLIAGGRTKKVDVGKIITHGQIYYYLNIVGLGFVADVNKNAHKLKIFGNFSYTMGVIYEILKLNSYDLEIDLDGTIINRKNIFVEVSNTRYTANFLMAPDAKIDDGYLDVTLLNKTSRRKLLKAFPKIFTGEHIYEDSIETFKAKKIKIKTSVPKILTPDGELLGLTPITIECLNKAVSVFWR